MRWGMLGPAVVVLWASATVAWAQPARVELDLGGVPLTMLRVPAGTFTEGTAPTVPGRNADEDARAVTVSRDFYLGEVPLLRGQYARFVDASGYRTEAEVGTSGGSGLEGGRLVQRAGFTWRNPGFAQTDAHPVVLVTVTDAERFLRWASGVTGRRLRLPTEAEWELACRGGGARPDAVEVRPALPVPTQGTRPAGGGPANGLGLYDLLGHVHQWTADVYGPYAPGPVTDPWGLSPPPGEPLRRVLRGASFLREGRHWRCAARSRNTPGTRNADNGFRVAMDLVAPPPAPPPAQPPTPGPLPEEPAPRESEGSSELLLVFALLAVALAVLALVLLFVWRRRRWVNLALDNRQRGQPAWASVRSVADGFWLRGPRQLHGARLSVLRTDQGSVTTTEVVYEHAPAGQFVYTGVRPKVVKVALVQAGAMFPGPAAGPRRPPASASHESHAGHGGHGGYGGHGGHGGHGGPADHGDAHSGSFDADIDDPPAY